MRTFILHYEGQHTSCATVVCCDFDLQKLASTDKGTERIAAALNMVGFVLEDQNLTIYPFDCTDMRILTPAMFPKQKKTNT